MVTRIASGLYHKIITVDEIYGSELNETIAKSANFVFPKGCWLVAADTASDYKIQHKKRGTSTWVDIYPAGTGGIVISDGANMRALNTDASNAATLVYFAIQ